jgi:tetratricopeptide (TPR) repeat protein
MKAAILYQLGIAASDTHREEALRLYEKSAALHKAVDDRWGTARALGAAGFNHYFLGAYDKAQALAEESLEIRRVLGDRLGMDVSFGTLMYVAAHRGRTEEAEGLAHEWLAMCQETGVRVEIAKGDLAFTMIFSGRFSESHLLIEEAMARRGDVGSRVDVLSRNTLALLKLHLGRYAEAHTDVQMDLSFVREMDFRLAIGGSLGVLGRVAVVKEAYAEAQEFLQESAAVFEENGFRTFLSEGLACLGYAARGLGNIRQAAQHLHEALRTAVEIGAAWLVFAALPAVALVRADQGDAERAVELYALASRYPHVANSRWFEDVAGKHIAAVAATLPPDVVFASQQRGRARDLWETAEELLEELGE